MNLDFLQKNENLIEVLSNSLEFSNVQTLGSFVQILRADLNISDFPTDFQNFLNETIICSDKAFPIEVSSCSTLKGINRQCRHHYDLVQSNITDLLSQNKKEYVQTFGYELRGDTFCSTRLNLTNKHLIFSPHFEELLHILGEEVITTILSFFYIFKKLTNSGYLQLTGPCLASFFAQNQGKPTWKVTPKYPYILDKKQENITNKRNFINRNLIFYCSVMNRKPGFFRHYPIISPNNWDYIQKITDVIVDGKSLNKGKSFIMRNFIEKTVKKIQKVDYNSILGRFCGINGEKYRDLKRKVKEIIAKKIENEKEIAEIFVDLYGMDTNYEGIYGFLREVLRESVDFRMLGKGNTLELLKVVKEFVKLKRFEAFTLNEMIARMNPLAIQWLTEKVNKKTKQIKFDRNRKILIEIIRWIFQEIIVPLIRSNFYVTEKHNEGSKIFYYRKAVWALISSLSLFTFEKDNMTRMNPSEVQEIIKAYSIPIAKLRILPKKNTFRPLMTFFRKPALPSTFSKRLPLNKILSDTHIVLRNLKETLSADPGFSVFDNDQIRRKFEGFVTEWRQKSSPKLYFLTMDIRKCYDSIDKNRLFSLIENSNLLEENYMINKYMIFSRNKKGIPKENPSKKHKFSRYFTMRERINAVEYQNIGVFAKYFNEKGFFRENPFVLVDSSKHRAIGKQEILEKLSIVLKYNIIQKKGIPQGLNISSVLCSFYITKIEENSLEFAKQEYPNSLNLVMRLIDDYLLITTEKAVAVNFLERMLGLAEENGFSFNEGKITTNFSYLFNGVERCGCLNSQSFENNLCVWIGKVIDMDTLEIIPLIQWDYERLLYGINANIIRKQMHLSLKNKLKSLLLNHLEFYFNRKINSEEKNMEILKNVAKSSCIKFFTYVVRLSKLYAKIFKEKRFLVGIMKNSIKEFCLYCCYLNNQESDKIKIFYHYYMLALNEFGEFYSQKRANFNHIYQGLKKHQDKMNLFLLKRIFVI